MAADENNFDPTESFTILAAGTMVGHYRIIEY
jgi:hypothetical protein